MNKLRQLIMLITSILVIMVAAVLRDGKLMGKDLTKDSSELSDSITERRLDDGTIVINTTLIGKNIMGYAGNVPLEIYLKDNSILEVKALKNQETPRFFVRTESVLNSWNGKSINDALAMEVDVVSGATYTSVAIIENMKQGLLYASENTKEYSIAEKMNLSWAYAIGLVVVLMASIIPLFWKNRIYRYIQLTLNVVVLGLWCGTFLSWSLLVNSISNGVNVWSSMIPIIMLVVAFVYPLFGKKQHYCTHVCPYGALQTLAGKANKRYKWRLSPKMISILTIFRQILFAFLLVLMLTGVWFSWMDYEFFTAFIWESAYIAITILAIVMVILALFVNQPYCRFVCPTGALLKLSENQKTI